MKKINLFAILLIMMAVTFSSCGANKQVAQTQQQRQVANNNGGLGEEIQMPCVLESMDDDEYFRDMGTATSINMQSARTGALQAAQDMIMQKLGGYVEGLSETYARTIAGQAAQDKAKMLKDTQQLQYSIFKIPKRILSSAFPVRSTPMTTSGLLTCRRIPAPESRMPANARIALCIACRK